MQGILCSMTECSGFHAASMNAEDSMHCGAMDPDCMQWSPCSEAQCIPMECSGFYAACLQQCNPCRVLKCIPIERSAFHVAGIKESRLNAVDSMQRGPMDLD